MQFSAVEIRIYCDNITLFYFYKRFKKKIFFFEKCSQLQSMQLKILDFHMNCLPADDKHEF